MRGERRLRVQQDRHRHTNRDTAPIGQRRVNGRLHTTQRRHEPPVNRPLSTPNRYPQTERVAVSPKSDGGMGVLSGLSTGPSQTGPIPPGTLKRPLYRRIEAS